ncbi:MAG: hypothetical protein ACTSXJ_06315 [Candidatus Baldrarchaeia archaeon]
MSTGEVDLMAALRSPQIIKEVPTEKIITLQEAIVRERANLSGVILSKKVNIPDKNLTKLLYALDTMFAEAHRVGELDKMAKLTISDVIADFLFPGEELEGLPLFVNKVEIFRNVDPYTGTPRDSEPLTVLENVFVTRTNRRIFFVKAGRDYKGEYDCFPIERGVLKNICGVNMNVRAGQWASLYYVERRGIRNVYFLHSTGASGIASIKSYDLAIIPLIVLGLLLVALSPVMFVLGIIKELEKVIMVLATGLVLAILGTLIRTRRLTATQPIRFESYGLSTLSILVNPFEKDLTPIDDHYYLIRMHLHPATTMDELRDWALAIWKDISDVYGGETIK